MRPQYTVAKLDSWEAFPSFTARFSANWAFRGQASAQWVLNNAIERTAFVHYGSGIEVNFIREFQRGARNYLQRDEIPHHLIEWLALMQHHGAPTRLLDLSRSPYIAAFFAYEICNELANDNVAIWGMNIRYLKERALEQMKDCYADELRQSNELINESLFEKIFYNNKEHLVFPVEPFRMNKRFSLQQSVFVSTGIAELPLMEQLRFLGDDLPKTLVKIELPVCDKKKALRHLQQMNLNRASLFPDLDGYASSMRLRYESMLTPEEEEALCRRRREDSDYPFIP